MRQCELKKRYDPDLDAYVTQHIYGEGIGDVFKSIGRKIFGKTAKSAAKSAAKKAATATSEYAGKKAGDKIVELLRGKIKQLHHQLYQKHHHFQLNMVRQNQMN